MAIPQFNFVVHRLGPYIWSVEGPSVIGENRRVYGEFNSIEEVKEFVLDHAADYLDLNPKELNPKEL